MIKQKIFRFELKKPNDLSNNPEAYCNIIQCGKYKFTLKNFKQIDGHDDSLPYSGDLYANNVFVCHCTNSGWGGQTDVSTNSTVENIRMQNIRKAISRYKWQYGTMTFDLSLEFIADTLAVSQSK